MMVSPTTFISQCQTEVIKLHQFFEAWLRGEVPATSETFARVRAVIGEGFVLISPNGQLTAKNALLDMVRLGHGQRADVRIWSENFQVRHIRDDLLLATYEEWQDNGGEVRGRLSTALFQSKAETPNGVQWLHVHETWLAD